MTSRADGVRVELTDKEVRAEFLRRLDVADHPYSRTPAPCCEKDPARHLGHGEIPWTLPPVWDMREILEEDA
jgi:hypothetical protein